MSNDPYLAISDNTTNIVIANGLGDPTEYRLAQGSWTPNVAALRSSQLGGRSVYNEVIEELDLHVFGSSADDCLAKIRTLNRLLEQAEQWYNGENVAPVWLRYSPAGSTITNASNPNQALILGRAPGSDTAALSLSPVESALLKHHHVQANIRLRFYRRGLWLIRSVVEGEPNGSGSNGEIVTLSSGTPLAYQAEFRPTNLLITNVGITGSNPYTYSDMIVLMTGSSTGLGIIDINSTSGLPATLTLVNDTANFCRTTNVLRYTPVGTSEVSTDVTYPTGLTQSAKLIGIWANIRNNSPTTTFQVRASLNYSYWQRMTPYTSIQPNTGPRWYFLGMIASEAPGPSLRYHIVAGAASGTLDTDAIVCADLSHEDFNTCMLIQPPSIGTSGGLNGIVFTAGEETRRQPLVHEIWNTTPMSYSGSAYFATRAGTLYVMILQTGRDTTTASWRAVSSGAVLNNEIFTTRFAAYLIPQ